MSEIAPKVHPSAQDLLHRGGQMPLTSLRRLLDERFALLGLLEGWHGCRQGELLAAMENCP